MLQLNWRKSWRFEREKNMYLWTLRNEIKAQYTVSIFKRLFQVNKVTQMNCLSKSLTWKQNVRDPGKHFTKSEYVWIMGQ